MPSYWDKPGSRNTNNSRNKDQPEEIPPTSEMTASSPPQDQNQGGTASLVDKVEEQFVIDPFAADINPGSSRRQKLFIEACAPLEDSKKLTASVEDQHIIL